MESSPAIPAATLITVRERPGGPPELLMVKRSEDMAFAGGALVFPGGRIDRGDRDLSNDELDAARIAAIRETIEETAVTCGLWPVPTPEVALEIQRELLAERDFGGIIDEHRLALELDALVPFARWVPKFHATRRFDTLFFLARASDPERQPNVCGGECIEALWITAEQALEREKSGEARLIFPTRRNLERLALHPSFDEMLRDARSHPIDPISPWVEEIGGENFITIPDGIGYPVTREKLDGLWRG